MAPLQGLVLDRFGPRRVIAVGVVVFGAGLAALATVGSLTGFYAALLVVGLGVSLTGYLSVTTAIVPWYLRRRATAMAWMALGASAGGLLVPLVAGAVVAFGWRPTVLASGLVMLLVGLPSAALLVVSAVIVHLVPHLSSGVGMSLTAAASVVAALTVVTAVGQALGGVLGDRVPKQRLAMGAMLAHAGGLLAPTSA